MSNTNRRTLIAAGLVAAARPLRTQPQDAAPAVPPKPVRPEPNRGARQDLDLIKAFVGAGHANKNLDVVKEMLAKDSKLVLAAWDWGAGDWETALGGASHTGSRDMARFLLEQGARIDSFCAAMLGERQVVAALIAANPAAVATRGPHGYTLLYHVAISGDVAMAEMLKPHLEPRPGIYNQALTAAVRDGHLEMTSWLLNNGAGNPNVEDALGKRPLEMAMEKGFTAVAEELRKHGAR
jgi:hypothetical protein